MATDWRSFWTPKRLKVQLPTSTTGFVLPSIKKIVYYQLLLVSFEQLLSLRLSDHFALVVGSINNNWLNLWKKDACKVFTGISPPLKSNDWWRGSCFSLFVFLLGTRRTQHWRLERRRHRGYFHHWKSWSSLGRQWKVLLASQWSLISSLRMGQPDLQVVCLHNFTWNEGWVHRAFWKKKRLD